MENKDRQYAARLTSDAREPLRNWKFTCTYGTTELGVMKVEGLANVASVLGETPVKLTAAYAHHSQLLDWWLNKRGYNPNANILNIRVTGGLSFRVLNPNPVALEWGELDGGANALLLHTLVLTHDGVDVKVL